MDMADGLVSPSCQQPGMGWDNYGGLNTLGEECVGGGEPAYICMHWQKKDGVMFARLSLANIPMTCDALHSILTPAAPWPGRQRACVHSSHPQLYRMAS